MLSLYEAAHLRAHGDPILEEALTFTTTHLKSLTMSSSRSSHFLAAQVKHALRQPIWKGLSRVEARRFISVYQEDPSHNELLLRFAKMDFSILQKLHQKELGEISRWNIDSPDQLPECIKYFYHALLQVYEEIEEEMVKAGRGYCIDYAKDAFCPKEMKGKCLRMIT
ncbi:hypothetical protein TIFTF001_050816 [Ficus carica]|uniref:(+)-delta-cadinene synthase n=1 Tax=Ficus carica TaxID=3494 RepID=A0AA87YNK3_FICCA|nr:hypothetical protein TIFTF001_050816 [Ficus carica]